MQVRDAQVIRLVERISEHYRINISNRYIRPALLQLPLEKQSWDLIEVFTEKLEQYRYEGFHLDELYHQIAAAAHFVSLARRELVPGLRNRIGSAGNSSGPDKVLRDMAVNNFASNLKLFADLLNELFIVLVELDRKDAKGHMPLYSTMPELAEIGKQLVDG
ncbi:MAG: hypothetical protein LBQ88_02265 [Treponema sp.]|nr:hypothetical protein [Treponema sp.]